MEKAKKIILIILLSIVLIILGLLLFIFIKNNSVTEEQFVAKLNNIGSEIYSTYYYPNVTVGMSEEEIKDTLSKYETLGLKFSLDEVEKIDDEYKKVIDNFINKNKQCSKEESMIIIYPQSPYTSDSFKMEVKIPCKYSE